MKSIFMRKFTLNVIIVVFALLQLVHAQQIRTSIAGTPEQALSAASTAQAPPLLSWIRYNSTVPGQASATVNVIFAIYKEQQGGQPLWQESQNVELDGTGHFSALLGLSSPDGVPPSIFSGSDAQWLSMRVNNGPEFPRALLVTVPYAMKAQSADALSGVPASDFVLRSQLPQLLQSIGSKPASAPAVFTAPSSSTLAGQPNATTVSNPTTAMQSNSATDVLLVEQDGSGFSLHAVGTDGSAIYAETAFSTSPNFTIVSLNRAQGGVGIRSVADASTGHGIAVWGVSNGDTGTGVLGETTQSTGTTYGVRGKTASNSGVGVMGVSLSGTGPTVGVMGGTVSPSGTAGVFDASRGGNILSGRTAGIEKFRVDASGNMAASGSVIGQFFAGDGSRLTNVNAASLGGLPAFSFLQSDSSGNVNLNAAYLGGLPASSYAVAGSAQNQTGLQSLVSTQLQINPDAASQSQHGFAGFVRDDLDSVHSIIGQAGMQTHFRLSRAVVDPDGGKDFLIVPYMWGMAMEYRGTIEAWSRNFSVHANNLLDPVGLKQGAQFWVGDQYDTGGLWVTANQTSPSDIGTVTIGADKFNHTSHGSLNFLTRNQTDAFRFLNGPWGLEKLQARLFTTVSTSNFDVDSGAMAGTMLADSAQNVVQIGARTGNRVDLITADSTPQLSVFPTGDVSIGSTTDSAKLAVGSSAQFQVSSAGAVTIGGGTPIAQHISVTAPLSITGLAPASCRVMTVAATGASDSDSVALGIPDAFASGGDLVLFGWVSAPDTVSIRLCNMGSADPGALSGTARVDIWKH